jgi:hypothetical protein
MVLPLLVLAVTRLASAQDTTQYVSVTVASTRARAVDLTTGALMAHGYSIETANEYAVSTTPSGRVWGGWAGKYRLTMHASLAAVGTDSVRVVLSAVATGIAQIPTNIANLPMPTAPVTSKRKPEWTELRSIRDDIAAASVAQAAPKVAPTPAP